MGYMTHESLACGQLVGSSTSDWGIIIGWYEAGNDSSGRTKSSVRWQNHSSQLDMFSAVKLWKILLQGFSFTGC